MLYNYLSILSLSTFMNDLNQKFNMFTDKFTNNGLSASFITIGLFIVLCIIVSRSANK